MTSIAEIKSQFASLQQDLTHDTKGLVMQVKQNLDEAQARFGQLTGDPMANSRTASAAEAIGLCVVRADELSQGLDVAGDALRQYAEVL